ncbi:MAG: TolC family outer membrane protein [Pseudomonadota bacterium]
MNVVFRSVYAGLAAGAALVVSAVPLHAQSLEEALVQSYLSNPTLMAARAQLRSVDENIAQALGGYRPTVTATGDLTQEWTETDVTSWDSSNPNSLNLTITQPLYTGGETEASTKVAENQIYAQRQSLLSTEQTVLLDVVTVYMNVVLARAVLELNRNNESRLERQLQATQDQFRVGEVTRTDVSQAQASLATAVADRLAAEGSLASAGADYEEIIGSPPAELSNPGPLVGIPATSDQASEIAETEHPDILSAQFFELAAIDGVDVEEADLLPDVDLVGSYTRNYDVSTTIDRQDVATIMAEVTVPLYQAGVASSEIRQAKQDVYQLREQVFETRREVLADVITAWEDLITARAQISAFQESVAANEIALEGTQREAEVGERTVLDILDAEQALFESQVDLVNAQRDEVVASYAVQSAIGRLTAERLQLPVELYDVEAYYREARDSWWGWGGLEVEE